MKGTKFQVGDKVRVRDCSYARVYNEVGQLSTIVGYRNRLYYVVGLHLYYAGELEAVHSKGGENMRERRLNANRQSD